MKGSNYLDWFRRLFVLGAVVAAGAMAANAGAIVPPPDGGPAVTANLRAGVGTPPDVQDAATALHGTPAGLKADGLRWQGIADAYQSASNSPTPLGLKAEGLRLQGMAQVYQRMQAGPDAFERYAAAHPYGLELSSPSSTVVSRPPDVADAALSVGTESSSTSAGFGWDDWGIGIGTGVGIALILGAGFLAGRGLRERSVQTV